MVQVGKKIKGCPQAETSSGVNFSLDSYKDNFLVLFFYPKDNTPGCTQESIEFSKKKNTFQKLGASVLGISKDSLKSHEKFITKQELKLDLVADVTTDICSFFDVLKQKSMFGRKYMGIERSTFLIGPGGVLLQEWRKVKVSGHVDEVYSYLKIHKQESSDK